MFKIISVSDWESGKVNIPDDNYIPSYSYRYPFLNGRLSCFYGERFGYVLSRDFADIFEDENG